MAKIEKIFKMVKLSSYYPQKIPIQIYQTQKFVEFQEKLKQNIDVLSITIANIKS